MKKLLIIIILSLGVLHTGMDVTNSYYDFTKNTNEQIENQTEEEALIQFQDGSDHISGQKLFSTTSIKLDLTNESNIWKPPVNS